MAQSKLELAVETGKWDSGLKRAQQALQKFTESNGGLNNALKTNGDKMSAFVRQMSTMETTAKTVGGRIKELSTLYTENAVAYKRLTDEQKNSPFGKELANYVQQLKGKLSDAKTELASVTGETQKSSSALSDLSSVLGVNIGSLTKFAGIAGVVSGAMKVAKDAFFSTEAGVDEWGRTVEAATSSYNAFCQSLANGDFNTFLGNLGNIIDRAKETYNALDNLKTVGGIISNQEAMLNSKRAKDLKTIRDPNATAAQKTAARADLKNIQSQKGAAIDETKLLNNNYIKSALRNQAGVLTDAEYNKYYSLIVRSLYDSAAKATLDKTKVKHQGVQAISNGNGQYTYQKTISEINVGDLFTDKFREGLNPYIQAYWNADTRKYNEERADNRVMGMGGSSGGGTGGGGRSIGTGSTTAPIDLYKFNAIIDKLDNTIDKNFGISSKAPGIAEQMGLTLNNPDVLSIKSLISGQGMPDEGVESFYEKLRKNNYDYNKGSGKGKKNNGKDITATEAASQIVGGLSGLSSGLQAFGLSQDSGFAKIIEKMGAVITIITSIESIVTAIEAISTIGSILPFAHGGVVPAYAAKGRYFQPHGTDTVPAMLTPGETVLTRAMTNNLATQLNGVGMGSMNLTATIKGEDLRFSLNNNSRRRGKGEYVTSRG